MTDTKLLLKQLRASCKEDGTLQLFAGDLINPNGPEAATLIESLEARIEEAEKVAFTFAFARGFQIAEETSRSCISAMDEAWEEYRGAKGEGVGG